MNEVQQRVRDIVQRYLSKFPNELRVIGDEGPDGNHWRVLRNWAAETYRQMYHPSDSDPEWRFISREVIATVQQVVSEILAAGKGE